MPKLIDYVGRFEFIRQAAFAVVRDDSVDALSRRRVAAELGTGVNTIRRSVAGWADLARLAADQVVSRRRLGRLGRYSEDPVEAAGLLVRSLVPEDESHLDEELVWLRLVAAYGFRPSGVEPPGELRREFGIAQRGYDDGLPAVPVGEPGDSAPGTAAAVEDRRTAVAPYVAEREADLTATVNRILDLLAVPEPRDDTASLLIAVVEGLTVSACLGRLTPEQVADLAVGFVTGLAEPQLATGQQTSVV
jgi:hypothetical protein